MGARSDEGLVWLKVFWGATTSLLMSAQHPPSVFQNFFRELDTLNAIELHFRGEYQHSISCLKSYSFSRPSALLP